MIKAYLIEVSSITQVSTVQCALRGLSTRGVDLDKAAPVA